MSKGIAKTGAGYGLKVEDLQKLIDVLRAQHYDVIGPTVRDRAIVYERIEKTGDLPRGWGDEQDGGTYRLKRRNDAALFGYACGPQSWKKFLLQPTLRLLQAEREGREVGVLTAECAAPKLALLGMRSCELRAMAIQDKVLTGGLYRDTFYAQRRKNALIVAVNCGAPGGTCFCASMQTGPRCATGYDLALTEILDGANHRFLVEAGSASGAALAGELRLAPARPADVAAAARITRNAARRMGRKLETEGLQELLYAQLEHPRWEETAARCLTCGNCTLACPTCFCTTVEDVTDLAGRQAERWRKWDSCFTIDFSHIYGGSVRHSVKSRYRQWMTHKLATWHDQFGSSGCVGCGRCITWCPVGIDITAEAAAIRGTRGGVRAGK